jgi:O-succinylbenzoate synthase
MEDRDQLRAQIIQATLKPSTRRVEEKQDTQSPDGVTPVNSSELASSIKAAQDSLLEQVLNKKAELNEEGDKAIEEKRKVAMEQTDFSLIGSLMGKMR